MWGVFRFTFIRDHRREPAPSEANTISLERRFISARPMFV